MLIECIFLSDVSMKKVLYISPLSSKRLIDDIHLRTGNNFVFAVQKFNRFVAKGLNLNGARVEIYSKPPLNDTVGKSWVSIPNEVEDDLNYNYISFYNVPVIKDIIVFVKAFTKVLKFGLFRREEKFVICDILSVSLNLGAVLASIICGIKIVGLVTDMPGLMVDSDQETQKSILSRLYSRINKRYISSYTHYVFLTEQMNQAINIHNRPYIVMEALCDNSLILYTEGTVKANPKHVVYAGGLHEKYGLKLLVDGFRMLTRDDVKLVIYGSGPYAEELKLISRKDPRIEYRGVATNDEVINAELQATLLVNPRPTTEEFTKYSFPSKNMEYMASGTPLLTTMLPGIPKDYYPYVYFFEDETVEGFALALSTVLNLSQDILSQKGLDAKEFVLENKNYVVQTSRILELVERNL